MSARNLHFSAAPLLNSVAPCEAPWDTTADGHSWNAILYGIKAQVQVTLHSVFCERRCCHLLPDLTYRGLLVINCHRVLLLHDVAALLDDHILRGSSTSRFLAARTAEYHNYLPGQSYVSHEFILPAVADLARRRVPQQLRPDAYARACATLEERYQSVSPMLLLEQHVMGESAVFDTLAHARRHLVQRATAFHGDTAAIISQHDKVVSASNAALLSALRDMAPSPRVALPVGIRLLEGYGCTSCFCFIIPGAPSPRIHCRCTVFDSTNALNYSSTRK
jgi:hypothetical protein